MPRKHLSVCVAMAATLALASTAAAKPPDVNSSKLRAAVTVDGIVEHQQALQNIADMNGGTRHTKTPGYTASVAYVRETMEAAGWDVSISQFDMPNWHETAPPVFQQLTPTARRMSPAPRPTTTARRSTTSRSSSRLPRGPERAGRADQRHRDPEHRRSTSGCEAADYPAATDGRDLADPARHVPVRAEARQRRGRGRGRRDPLQRGQHAGPHERPVPRRPDRSRASRRCSRASRSARSSTTPGQSRPCACKTNGVNVDRFYPQVIAESKSGDPNHVVLAGAHLDSVTAGPGINDDGSGTAWQLELGEQIPKLGTQPRHKIRLMWFGGEEDGLVGSQYYAEHLSQAEVNKIDVMIDTDMIASPNYARLVYDGDGDELGPGRPARLRRRRERVQALLRPARHGQLTTSRSTAARTTSASSTAASRPAASSPGAEVPKTAAQVALFGGVAGEQLRPVLPRGVRQHRHGHGPAARRAR